MQSLTTLILAHEEMPGLSAKTITHPGCTRPHVLVQTLDENFGIVGHPDDLIMFAECLKRAAELRIPYMQESAKNCNREGN